MGQAFSTGLQSAVLEGLTDVIEDLGDEGLQQSLSSIGELLGNVIVLFGQFAAGLISFVDVVSNQATRFFEAQGQALEAQSIAFGAGSTQPLPNRGRIPRSRRADGR